MKPNSEFDTDERRTELPTTYYSLGQPSYTSYTRVNWVLQSVPFDAVLIYAVWAKYKWHVYRNVHIWLKE